MCGADGGPPSRSCPRSHRSRGPDSPRARDARTVGLGPGRRRFARFPSGEVLQAVPAEVRRSVIAAADEILAGQWQLLGAVRQDMEDPDWFFDPVTGKRAPQVDYCFKVNHRSEDVTGNVKQIWELSRMHHLTVLAAAFSLSGDERYANAPPPISVPGGLRTRSSPACTGRAESRPGYG